MKTNYLRALLSITWIVVLAGTGVTQRAQGQNNSISASVTFNDFVVTNPVTLQTTTPRIWSDGRPYVDKQNCVTANVSNSGGNFFLKTVTRGCSSRLVNLDFSLFVPSDQVSPPQDGCPTSLASCTVVPNLLSQVGALTLNCPSGSVNAVPDVQMRAGGLFNTVDGFTHQPVLIDLNFLKFDAKTGTLKPDFSYTSKAFRVMYIQSLYVKTVSPKIRILTTGTDRSKANLIRYNADGSPSECLGVFEMPLEITVTK